MSIPDHRAAFHSMTPQERKDLIEPLREALREVNPRGFSGRTKQGGNNPRRKRKRTATKDSA